MDEKAMGEKCARQFSAADGERLYQLTYMTRFETEQ